MSKAKDKPNLPKQAKASETSPDLRNLVGFFDILVQIDLANRKTKKLENTLDNNIINM